MPIFRLLTKSTPIAYQPSSPPGQSLCGDLGRAGAIRAPQQPSQSPQQSPLQTASLVSQIGVFVINLDQSRERWQHSATLFSSLGLPLQRVKGVDGTRLDLGDLDQVDHRLHRQVFGADMGAGTLGCALGHHQAWQDFLASSFSLGLICEDDIDVADRQAFLDVLNDLVHHSALWDICNLHINHRGAPLSLCQLSNGWTLCAYRLPVTGGGCYLLSRQAARQLLAKARPTGLPIDHYFARSWEFGLRFVGVERAPRAQDLFLSRPNDRVRAVRLVYPKAGFKSEIALRGRSVGRGGSQGPSARRQRRGGLVRHLTLVATAWGFLTSALRLWATIRLNRCVKKTVCHQKPFNSGGQRSAR
jgi:glycosyl transferase, family 25